MKSHRHNRSTKRSRWAKADARAEERAATLPPVDPGPEPLSVWQSFVVLGSHGQLMHTLTLYVPTAGRCDQHAAEIDGVRCDALVTATEAGRMLARWVAKRPSFAQQAEARAYP